MTSTMATGAACYFCLGEEDDEEGKPLVRNCSCRGDSAGFAHLSCLTKYAEQKCNQARDGDMSAFTEPWKYCNNCKQPFQGQLSIDLSSAFVSFAEATYSHEGNSKWDKMKVLSALRVKIMALHDTVDKEMVKVEMTLLTHQLLDMIAQTKKDLNMSRWIHMPHDSEEYQYYTVLCGNYESFAHHELGSMLMSDTSEEGFKVMITHFKKASAICKLVGMKDRATNLDIMISGQLSKYDEDAFSTVTMSMMQKTKNDYEQSLTTFGMNSEGTIQAGLGYAFLLRSKNRLIEAERLAIKVATASRQVHGPHHKTTLEANELLETCKERFVWVLPEKQQFQALRYENDGEICVVQGPVTKPRLVADERIHHVDNNLIVPAVHCPVVCHGLVNASHLNGEVGEVRDVRDVKKSGTGIRLAVHFEKKVGKSALVKTENLRIAFKLPDEKD
jgi:hypothetical protein